MENDILFEEKLSSNRTEALFVLLMALFLVLGGRRVNARGFDLLAVIFLGFGLFFLFYALNYRVLVIHLTPDALHLRFGLFTWPIALNNIERCFLDETSLWRIGGAGIHFSPIQGRYRAMFNFLTYPRIVIALKEKRGPVRDIAFSTRQPDRLLTLLRESIA